MTTVTLHFPLLLLSLLLLERLMRFPPGSELIAGSMSRISTAERSGKSQDRRADLQGASSSAQGWFVERRVASCESEMNARGGDGGLQGQCRIPSVS